MRCLVASAAVAAGVLLIAAGTASASGGKPAGALYVSPHGSAVAAGKNCGTATFSTIGSAVAAASEGGTVVVCPGTYAEDVIVQKALTLIGQNATIDAAGLENAIQVVASDVSVSGFTLENANGEGLLVGIDSFADIGLLPESGPVLSGVTIDHVKAINDDKGFNGTENGNCKYPGDCGGGIHLNVVANSTISDSKVVGNADGILMTDDYGPNHHNLIVGNYVADNKTECGIVLPGHNGDAVNFVVNGDGSMTVTGRNPDLGGVYDNVIRDNVTIDNGTATAPPQFGGVGGSGGGVGIFGSFPGAGAYDNLVEGNYIAGNGLAGVTIHAHHPGGSDVNGNQIINNSFDTNNVMGDVFDGGISNFQTTAIAVYSVPAAQMTISGNKIRNNSIGIWLTDTVDALGLDNNQYAHVGTSVVTEPAN
ncbi:MAG: hypothetical protein ACXVRS_00715 [Gaiellaceae bacterium]